MKKGSLWPLALLLFLPWWACLILGFAFPYIVVFGLPILLVITGIKWLLNLVR